MSEKQPGEAQQRDSLSKDQSSDSAIGTEASEKGGASPAKRQAERDWENSPKEEGE